MSSGIIVTIKSPPQTKFLTRSMKFTKYPDISASQSYDGVGLDWKPLERYRIRANTEPDDENSLQLRTEDLLRPPEHTTATGLQDAFQVHDG